MKKVLFLVSFVLVFGFVINYVYAVKKYNASKSNTCSISEAYGQVTKLAEEAKLEALQIASQMISQEQARRGDDQVKVVITIGVEVERAPKSSRSDGISLYEEVIPAKSR